MHGVRQIETNGQNNDTVGTNETIEFEFLCDTPINDCLNVNFHQVIILLFKSSRCFAGGKSAEHSPGLIWRLLLNRFFSNIKIAYGMIWIVFLTGLQFQSYSQERPNIILIVADDMGYSDIGSYGSEIPTPNLDNLARNGIRFNQFYNTARCCPTRASLMTGLYPHQTGIGNMTEEPGTNNSADWGTPGYKGYLNKNCVTIAEALSAAGYHSYMAGKWHLGILGEEKWPLQRGFEKYYGILAGASSYLKPQGLRKLYSNNTALPPPAGNYYTTDAFTDSAISFITNQQDRAPFFLYLAYNAPHWPLQAKQPDIQKFEKTYLKGWDSIRQERYDRQLKLGVIDKNTQLSERDSTVRPWNSLNEQEQKEVAYRMAVYAAQISCLDQNVGKLVDALKRENKFQNTLIIFLSDNGACAEPYKELGGGNFNEINDPEKWGPVSYGVGWANASNTPFRKWKRELEEGGMAAPFILSWPSAIKGKQTNTVVSTPSYLIDVMPTLLGVAHANYPTEFNGNTILPLEGRSLLPAIKDGPLSEHAYMYWEHDGNQAIRKGQWKAVKDNKSKEWELYNLLNGRNEEQNVAGQNPGLLKELITEWNRWARTHAVLPKRKKKDEQ